MNSTASTITSTRPMPDWWAQMQREFTRDQATAMQRAPAAPCECATCGAMGMAAVA